MLATMPEIIDKAQWLLKPQLKPALVLDASETVIAINPGGLRLIYTSPISINRSTPHPVIGSKISDLGIAIASNSSPALWTWNDILVTVANGCTEPNENEQERAFPSNSDISQATDDFWDVEAKNQSLIESDVYFIRTASNVSLSGSSRDAEETFKVKARANVCWYPPGVFLVIFDRPFMSPSLGRNISLAASHPQYIDDRPLLSTSGTRLSPSSGIRTDWQDHAPSATHVASLIPYMMVTMNEEGHVVQCSDSWHHFTGLSKEESLGSGWVSAIHPGDVVMMASGWADVIRNKRQEWSYEARYLQASTGNYCWFSIRAQAYKNASGQVICWYASMMDVNDGVKARREADQRRDSILRLISQTGVLLWGVTRSNRSYIREGGLDWDPPKISEYLQPTAGQENAHLAQDSGMSNQQEHEELVSVVQAILLGHKFKPVVEHAEGERHFRTIFIAEHSTSATATGNDVTTEAALALTFDITDQFVQSALRLENERLAFDEKAASEASAMKSRFLANVSHEIRTPISGIIGLSELLCGSRIGKEHTDLVCDIRTSAQFLLTLVNDILDLSKIEVGLLSLESLPFTLSETIQETFAPLQLQAKEKGLHIGWTCDIGVTTATILGDPHRLRQILTNLVGNSIKFTHTGTICLCVKTLQSEDTETTNIQFVVQDSGIGIAEEAKSLLFKPFSQANSSTARIYGGTGLGLSICQELIELMGGHINLQSAVGKGTTVTFNVQFKIDSSSRLPERTRTEDLSRIAVAEKSTEQDSVQTQFSQHSDPKAFGSRISILIADDNPINRKINSLFIMRSGYDVATVCDGQEALDYLCKSSSQPRPDLVFMDCMMPGIDGYEATRRIRTDTDLFDEQTRRLPIVALTASVLQKDKERCWEVGMNDYISRPIYQQTLKDAVLKWTLPKDT